jgi:hypothetical protein
MQLNQLNWKFFKLEESWTNSDLAGWLICTHFFKWPTYTTLYATLVPHLSVGVGPLTVLSEIFGKYMSLVITLIYSIQYSVVRYRAYSWFKTSQYTRVLRELFLFAEADKQTRINHGQSAFETSRSAGILICLLYIYHPDIRNTYLSSSQRTWRRSFTGS